MKADARRPRHNHWQVWLLATILVSLSVVVCLLLPHIGIGQGITVANSRRIAAGMTLQETEAVLGAPNSISPVGGNKSLFWDKNAVFGFLYVSIHVDYDNNGNVTEYRGTSYWRRPVWAFW